jgi:DNA repair photolyase
MEGIWEAMRDHANPCSVLTKSPLLLRDIDLFRQLCEVTQFSTALSIPTIDEKVWRETEPHTPHPRKRLEAIAELTRSGIPCSVLVAPLIPGVNDNPRQVEEILDVAGRNGAASVTGIGLHLRRDVRDIFFDWLRQYRPDLLDRYEELYRRGAYLPSEEKKRLGALTNGFRGKPGTPRPRGFGGRGISRERAEAKRSPPEKRPEQKQPSLF